MNGYIVFYGKHSAEIHATTSYQAQQEYARLYNVPSSKRWRISVHLCQTADGKEVTIQL